MEAPVSNLLTKQHDEMHLYIYIYSQLRYIKDNVLNSKNDLQVEMLYGPLGDILSIVDKMSGSSAGPILAYGNYCIALNND